MTDLAHNRDDPVRLWEPHIHAFTALCKEAPRNTGPLFGLRIGVKDIIDVAGVPTRNGSMACKDAKPALQDAQVVEMLRLAGADIVGKTTTTEFAFTDPTACRNPYDLRRSPGGSSSGSGAAVAAGVVDIALGTQTAGSLCRPAAYCGVVGFKPTYGVFSTAGVTPLAPSFDAMGIMARSVALAQKTFAVLGAADSGQHDVMPARVLSGFWQTETLPSGDTLAALHAATDVTAGLQMDITDTGLTADVGSIVTAHRIVMNHEAYLAHGAMLTDARADLLKPKFKAGLRAGATISPDQAAKAKAFLRKAKSAFWDRSDHVDMILTLPVPEGAPLIDGTTGFQDWLTPWTVFGGPLVCLPWGIDRLGRPLSVMLAGRPGEDHRLLATAARIEANSPYLPPPTPP